MKKTIVYLSAPYSHPDPAVRAHRFAAINAACALLLNAGRIVFSPISMTHPIAEKHHLPGDFAYWRKFNETYLAVSSEMIVLPLPGWKESIGVRGEAAYCLRNNIQFTVCGQTDPTRLDVDSTIWLRLEAEKCE